MTTPHTICGSLPTEECNRKTHDVHSRLWEEIYEPDPAYSYLKRRHPERPNCKCHDEPMWSASLRWICRIRMGAAPGTFATTDRGARRVDT